MGRFARLIRTAKNGSFLHSMKLTLEVLYNSSYVNVHVLRYQGELMTRSVRKFSSDFYRIIPIWKKT